MSTNHTPGPWVNGYGNGITGPTTPAVSGATVGEVMAFRRWEQLGFPEDRGNKQKSIVVTCGEETLAIVPTNGRQCGKANASLIAAAPELLGALCDMVSDRDCLSEGTINFARAAIAKAKGES